MIPADDMSFNADALQDTYTMNNVLPLNAYSNEAGAWRQTEDLTSKNAKDSSIVRQQIIGGVVYGENEQYLQPHDVYVASHW